MPHEDATCLVTHVRPILGVAAGAPQLPQFAILSLTWLAIDLTTMSSYATMGSGIGRWFHSPRRVQLFNRTTGSLFIATGGTLAASHR